MNKSYKNTDIINFSSQYDSFYVAGSNKHLKKIRAYFNGRSKLNTAGVFELVLSYLKSIYDVPLYMQVKALQEVWIVKKIDDKVIKDKLKELLFNYLKK